MRLRAMILAATVILSVLSAESTAADNSSDAAIPEIGSRIPDLRFKDIRALPRSLSEMGTHKAWVVVFTTTQCPLVKQTLPKLAELQRSHKDSDVQFVAINVGTDDTIREMAAQAIDLDVPFAFVKDVDHSCVRALGVQRTPEVVVLDQELRLRYRGRDMTFSSVTSDAKRETLLQIPNYNFEWQLGYEIEPGKKRLSKGTAVEAVAHFDNSAFNPYNPVTAIAFPGISLLGYYLGLLVCSGTALMMRLISRKQALELLTMGRTWPEAWLERLDVIERLGGS